MVNRGLCLGILIAMLPLVAYGKVEMIVRPAVGPGFSSNLRAFGENAMTALAQGKQVVGDPLRDPLAFKQVDEITVGQLIVSGFVSWSGVAGHGIKGFEKERGSRVHFSLQILGNGQKIRLADLAFDLQSSDALNAMNEQGNFKASTYSIYRQGIDYGPDGKRNTADDKIFKDNEPSILPVDEIRYLGVGIGMKPGKLPSQKKEQQAQIDGVILALMGTQTSFDLKMTYTLNLPEVQSVSATVNVLPQPEVVLIGPQPESPLPLFLGVGGGLAVALAVAGVRKVMRRRRYATLADTLLMDDLSETEN